MTGFVREADLPDCVQSVKSRNAVYVVLLHSGTIPSRIVRLVTGYPYSHAALSLQPDCDALYSFGRRSLRNFLNGGFVREQRDGAFFRKYRESDCRVYRVDVTEEQYDLVEALLEPYIRHPDRYRYDFLGAFLRFFHIPARFRNRHVCSSFVAEILCGAGICAFSKPICMVKPEDFSHVPGFVPVYEGKYRSMNE